MSHAKDFSGTIYVAATIVDYLSSGLYESPSACIKELVNNAYDADATRVDLYIKPDADLIMVVDDGHGMTKEEFKRHFEVIAESHKREGDTKTDTGRPKIGKIGIGFIAANEICDTMEIVSTVRGSKELLRVEILFEEMRVPARQRKVKGSKAEVEKADYRGTIEAASLEDHYTHLFLKQVKGQARELLLHRGTTPYSSGNLSIYGKRPSSVEEMLKSADLKTWNDFDPYSKSILEVGLNVPVRYHEDWMPAELRGDVLDFERRTEDLDFQLFVDGGEVKKPVVFAGTEKNFVSRFDYSGEYVAANGYFYAQHGSIRPQELRGLLLRIRNAAVGGHDPTFMDFSPSRSSLLQGWISGEIWADDRLEAAMNIDRRTLRVSDPAYVELQGAVHAHVAEVLSRIRNEVYGAGSQKRKEEKARTVQDRIMRVIREVAPKVSGDLSSELERHWSSIEPSKERKVLLQRFGVDELYDLVLRVARDTLGPEDFQKFVLLLTRRLREK